MKHSRIAIVTGAAGFIGGHLTRKLRDEGFVVGGLGHGDMPQNERHERGLSMWVNGDVNRSNLTCIATELGCPQSIFHLAGGSSVAASMMAPYADYEKTCTSTMEVAEWVRIQSPETKVNFVSSAAVYGNKHSKPIIEASVLEPYSIYGMSKYIAELLLSAYSKNYGLNISIVRLFSVYGPGLRKQLLWDICNRLASGVDSLSLGGEGVERRDWIHVRDAVSIILAAMRATGPEPYIVNGGTGIGIDVATIARRLAFAYSGKEVDLVFSGLKRAGDPDYLVADTGRVRGLGIATHCDLDSGLKEYVTWFKQEISIR